MHRTSILSALGIALVIVLGLDYASLATTGRHLVLGHRNSADRMTPLTRTSPGPRVITDTQVLTAPVASVDVPVAPPPGHYLVSYSAYLVGAARAAVDCYVSSETDGVATIVGENRFTAGVSTPGLTGSVLVTKTAGSALGLLCRSGTPFRTSSGQPIQLVLTAVDTLTMGTPGAPRRRTSRP